MIARSKEPELPPILLNSRDAARSLAVSERTLARLVRRGDIAPVRLLGGRSLRFAVCELERFASQQQQATEAVTEPPP